MRKNISCWTVLLFCLLLWPPFHFSQRNEGRGSFAEGPLGAVTRPPKAVQVPASIAALLPKKAVVRGMLQAHLTREGEELVIYEIPFEPGKDEVCCAYGALVLRNGKLVSDLKEEMAESEVSLQAYALFSLESGRDAVVCAFSSSGDGSGIDFEIIWGEGSQYKAGFAPTTTQGRIEILEGKLAQLRVWSVAEAVDYKTSCVWCEHHYQIKGFIWDGKQFDEQQRVKETTQKAISPATVASQPIVVRRNPKT